MTDFTKYKVVQKAIDKELASFLAATLLLDERSGKLADDATQVKGSTVVHGHGVMDALLLKMLPVMQRETGLELLPTYSFARIYRKGDVLEKHKDRPSCEISTTLTLDYIANDIWPIFADESGPIKLAHGDMLIYRGCDVEHWRDAFQGKLWVQVFLHYVDVNGPHADCAFDKRDVGEFYETVYGTFFKEG